MTKEQMRAEILYQASVATFVRMENEGLITREDLRVIVTVLARKYSPVFVHYIAPN